MCRYVPRRKRFKRWEFILARKSFADRTGTAAIKTVHNRQFIYRFPSFSVYGSRLFGKTLVMSINGFRRPQCRTRLKINVKRVTSCMAEVSSQSDPRRITFDCSQFTDSRKDGRRLLLPDESICFQRCRLHPMQVYRCCGVGLRCTATPRPTATSLSAETYHSDHERSAPVVQRCVKPRSPGAIIIQCSANLETN